MRRALPARTDNPSVTRTRRRFVAVTVAILALVVFAMLLTICVILRLREKADAYNELNKRLELPEGPFGPGAGAYFDYMRSFTISVDGEGNIVKAKYDTNAFEFETLRTITEQALARGDARGSVGSYCYVLERTLSGARLAGMDRSVELAVYWRTVLVLSLSGTGCLIALFLAVWWLSFRVVRPVEEAFARQKQFVSDASHELKTPLTVISANAEALRSETGDNPWLNNITDQTARMNTLVLDLLQLAKLEETAPGEALPFSLSKAVTACVLNFDAIAFERHKTIEADIAPDLTIVGSEDAVRQATTILLDNAVKHSDEAGNIRVTLRSDDARPVLTVENSGCRFRDDERDRLFERFYRSDSARDRASGGSGLGLPIVKSLAERNRWRLTLESAQGEYTRFILRF